ncbi:hypothetical protein [Psychrobacillus vulpis]|nr:hypothetical protein [Psychrobacillus vulpis]
MVYIAWLAFAVATGAMFEASTTRKKLEKRVNELEIEVELLKYDKKHGGF